jgi:hypothetical protein
LARVRSWSLVVAANLTQASQKKRADLGITSD